MADNTDNENRKTLLSLRVTVAGVVVTLIMLAVFGIIFWMFMKNENKTEYYYSSPKIVLFGDSIFAYYQDENSVAHRLSDKLGEEVFDASFGGTCLAYTDRDGRLDDTSDAMSLAALTQAITAYDFRYQENSVDSVSSADYFESRLGELKKTDLSKTEIVVIEHLVNDYHNAIPLETGSDKYDEYTYEGALRSVVSRLKKKYPSLRIIIAAPPLTWYPAVSDTVDEYGRKAELRDYANMTAATEKDYGGGIVTGYRRVQKSVADELGIEYIDLSECMDNESVENIFTYSVDGLHPNENGAERIAEYMAEYIRNNR
jgi:lysophospholipase L1-like esterase